MARGNQREKSREKNLAKQAASVSTAELAFVQDVNADCKLETQEYCKSPQNAQPIAKSEC